jgi:hypothetical protein
MIETGERIPGGARVWVAPSTDPVPLDALIADGPILLLFYLYDWSST